MNESDPKTQWKIGCPMTSSSMTKPLQLASNPLMEASHPENQSTHQPKSIKWVHSTDPTAGGTNNAFESRPSDFQGFRQSGPQFWPYLKREPQQMNPNLNHQMSQAPGHFTSTCSGKFKEFILSDGGRGLRSVCLPPLSPPKVLTLAS